VIEGAAARKFDDAEAFALGAAELVADPCGVLYWPGENLLVVADMHLEKGSSFARYGQFLPPYDTAATLSRLALAIARYNPRAIFALGDSFHDGDGPSRLSADDREALLAMQRGRDWIWLAGNHDPDPAIGIGGQFTATLAIGPLNFRHEPTAHSDEFEIAGHLHPVARVAARGRAVSRRCFALSEKRMVMPAFGAYAGGLNIRHEAFTGVFPTLSFTAHLLGATRLYAMPAGSCLPD
jgi:DNA ligase-associated metallophosphoesterase